MTGLMGYVYGVPVVVSNQAVSFYQFKFPKSKRKRIRKKFRKNTKNFKTEPAIFKVDSGIICHPSIYEKIKSEVSTV